MIIEWCTIIHIQVLNDKEKRSIYDRYGEEGLKNDHGGGGGGFDPFSSFGRFVDVVVEVVGVILGHFNNGTLWRMVYFVNDNS